MNKRRFNFKKSFLTRNFKQIQILLFILTSGVLLVHMRNQNVDFRVFYDSGRYLFHGVSPYLHSKDPFAQYLNGPLTLIFLSPFTLFKYDLALQLFRIFSFVAAYQIIKYFFNPKEYSTWMYLTFAILAFSFRANIQYGALGIFFLFIFFQGLKMLKDQNVILNYIGYLFLASCIDFKPYLFLPLFLIFSENKRLKNISLIIILIVSEITFFSFLINQNIFSDIFSAYKIRYRAYGGGDQMDLRSIFIYLNFNKFEADIFYFLLIFIVVLLIKKTKIELRKPPIILLCAGIVFLPFLHPTDLFLPTIVSLSYFFSKKFNVGKIEWFCLGSIFVWSNSIIYAMFVIIILVLAMLLSDFKKYHKNAPFFIFPSLIFPFICKVSPWAESFNRRFFNIGGLVFLILITIPYLSRKDIEIERIFKSLTF